MKLKLSVQGLNAMMIALQNALQNESDIVPELEGWDWAIYDPQDGSRVGLTEESEKVFELYVQNPPTFELFTNDSDNVELEEV